MYLRLNLLLKQPKQLNPSGSSMNNGIQVILIGDFEDRVRQSIEKQGFKVDAITGNDPAVMAKQLDDYYAKASGGSYPRE